MGRETLQNHDNAIDWLARARALAPVLEAAADGNEQQRRIADNVIAAIEDAGLLKMLLPVSLGGGAADVMTYNSVIEALSAIDASTGWCMAQTLASSHAAGFLPPDIAREIFSAPRAIMAWGPPGGPTRAQVVDGGYRVSGKWRFASGSANATWMGGHSQVYERDGTPRLDAAGRPVMRTMLFLPSQVTIHDTWHTVGLRGTSTNDYEVADLFVPEAYSTWRDSVPDRREAGPLYNIPLLTLYGIGFSGVALGLAEASLRAFMALAPTKRSAGGVGATGFLRDNAVIQSKTAQVTGRLQAARGYLRQTLRDYWNTSCKVGTFSLELRATLRIAIVSAIDTAREVVDFAFQSAGTTAIFERGPFARRFRDMHTLLAQGQTHLSNFESAGQALFGIEPTQRL